MVLWVCKRVVWSWCSIVLLFVVVESYLDVILLLEVGFNLLLIGEIVKVWFSFVVVVIICNMIMMNKLWYKKWV